MPQIAGWLGQLVPARVRPARWVARTSLPRGGGWTTRPHGDAGRKEGDKGSRNIPSPAKALGVVGLEFPAVLIKILPRTFFPGSRWTVHDLLLLIHKYVPMMEAGDYTRAGGMLRVSHPALAGESTAIALGVNPFPWPGAEQQDGRLVPAEQGWELAGGSQNPGKEEN